jgi:hypothetical protein
MLTQLSQTWQNNAWVNYSQYTCTYDANNNRLTYLFQTWQNDAWLNDWQYTYTYDANNNRLTHLFQTWQNDAWLNEWQYTYTYDANNNGVLSEYKKWIDGSWQNADDNVYLYYNNMQSSVVFSGYKVTATYKKFNVVSIYSVTVSVNNEAYGTATGGGEYEENTTATIEATAYEGYKFVNWTKNGVEISTDNPYNFTVMEAVELVANFAEEVGIVKTDNYPSLQVYPNPTKGQLTVEMGDMRLSDMSISTGSTSVETCDIEIYDIYGKKTSSLKSQIPSLKSQNRCFAFAKRYLFFEDRM